MYIDKDEIAKIPYIFFYDRICMWNKEFLLHANYLLSEISCIMNIYIYMQMTSFCIVVTIY